MDRWGVLQIIVAIVFSVAAIGVALSQGVTMDDPLEDCERAFGTDFAHAHYLTGTPVLLLCEYDNGSALLTRPL